MSVRVFKFFTKYLPKVKKHIDYSCSDITASFEGVTADFIRSCRSHPGDFLAKLLKDDLVHRPWAVVGLFHVPQMSVF